MLRIAITFIAQLILIRLHYEMHGKAEKPLDCHYKCEYTTHTMTFKKENAAHTSNADKVLSAVQEVRKEEDKPIFTCVKCGSNDFTTRRPLGGPLIRICSKCGSKQYRGSGTIAPLLPENLNHKQGQARGPAYSATPKPKQDKHQPRYRSKGKTKK